VKEERDLRQCLLVIPNLPYTEPRPYFDAVDARLTVAEQVQQRI
jgi:hypothetical protein